MEQHEENCLYIRGSHWESFKTHNLLRLFVMKGSSIHKTLADDQLLRSRLSQASQKRNQTRVKKLSTFFYLPGL